MKKLATIISTVGHPLLTIPLYMLIVNHLNLISWLIIGSVLVPLTITLFLKSRNGTYTNFDVSDRHQRKSMYILAICLLSITTIITYTNQQSYNTCTNTLFALILITFSFIVNYFIKSSIHVSLSIFLSALIFASNYKIAIAYFVFSLLIGWSRVKLGRHNTKEVFCGAIIGTLVCFIMLKMEGYI
jgi:membrane-associated phospholipid phosphatase